MAGTRYIHGMAEVYLGTAGAATGAATQLFKTDGAKITSNTDTNEFFIEERDGLVLNLKTKETAEITLNVAEATAAMLGVLLPGAKVSGSVVSFGTVPIVTRSMKITAHGTDKSTGAAILQTYLFNYVEGAGSQGTEFKKGEVTLVPVTFKVLTDFGVAVGDGDLWNMTES